MHRVHHGLLIFASIAASSASFAQRPSLQSPNSGIDRLCVLECGHGFALNQGRFATGYNDGKPFELIDSSYLIHH
jgi:hypothetical protein